MEVGAVLEADEAADIEEVQAWAAGLDALHARIAGRFARAEPRRRALAYLRGLLGNVGRKNGWQLAEHAGERTPDGMQRLLATADWDPDRVRDDLRAYVVEHLGDPSAVLVADETGFLKKGTTSVGVQRQYSGTAGKVDNCQLGVFLAYASPKGRAMIDRELYLPKAWSDDPERCRAARVPAEVGFRTKPQLAQLMLARALDAGVPAAWVTADEVYGGSPALREWLEERHMPYVLTVKCTELLEAPDPDGRVGPRTSAEQLAAGIPAEQWIACSAGHGAKGRRLYDWTRLQLAAPATAGMARWLLVRRSRRDGELAFYACYGPAATPLIGLVRVAGTRWAVEEGFEQAKGEVGLDHYEVRRWPGWYRHITLALLAHAFLAVTRAQATSPERARGTRQPDRRARPATADRARGPPAAGRAGVDHPGHAGLRAGLVTMAPTPSGPRQARTLPPPRKTSAAGVLSSSSKVLSVAQAT
jgi:SRSO17 transposase